MARPKIPKEKRKVILGVTISNHLSELLKKETHNKSKFIEDLLENYFNRKNEIK